MGVFGQCPVTTRPQLSRSGVHLLFLDGSGRIDPDGVFALGGIAVRDTDWPHLHDVWQETLRTHGWPREDGQRVYAASSAKRQCAFTIRIWSIVRQRIPSSFGLATNRAAPSPATVGRGPTAASR